MKNKRFTIFRRFTTLVAKANFWGFWALKGPIFIILTPVLFNMLHYAILHRGGGNHTPFFRKTQFRVMPSVIEMRSIRNF